MIAPTFGEDTTSEMCTVCRVVVSETRWSVKHAAHQKLEQRSLENKVVRKTLLENHLEEVFDNICNKFHHYAELSTEDGAKHVVRTKGLDGKRLQMDYLDLDERVGRKLSYVCDDFLEDHFVNLIGLLSSENVADSDFEKVICGEGEEGTKVCPMKVLDTPMVTLPEATEEEEKDPDAHDEDEEDGDDEDDDDGQLLPADDPKIHLDPVEEVEEEMEETVYDEVTVDPRDVNPIYLINEHLPDDFVHSDYRRQEL